jgi:hypothetical protein
MLEIADNANLHPRAGDVGEAESARETLIAVGVVVLEVELEVNRLLEVALLLVLGEGDDFLDGGGKFVGGDFRHLRGFGFGWWVEDQVCSCSLFRLAVAGVFLQQ